MGTFDNIPLPGESLAGATSGGIGLTNSLWTGIDIQRALTDRSYGYGIDKDFCDAGVYATTVAQDGIYPFQDTSDTIRGLARAGGGLEIATAATDNNGPAIQWGGLTGGPYSISKTAPRDLGFEFLFEVDTIIETGISIGLGVPGMAANDGFLVDDTGAAADKSWVGFRGPMHASILTTICNYRLLGQAEVTALAAAHVPAVNTLYSYGFRYRRLTKYGEWWINGTKVKELDFSNTTAVPTATCPFDVGLSPFVGIKAGASAAKSLVLLRATCIQRW